MARKSWSGTTGEVDEATGRLETTPILGAPFWREGVKVAGIFVRQFETPVGKCNEFMSVKDIEVQLDEKGRVALNGTKKTITRFAMGSLTGWEIALQKLDGFDGFKYGDQVTAECIGFQKSKDEMRSDMPMFKVTVDRN